MRRSVIGLLGLLLAVAGCTGSEGDAPTTTTLSVVVQTTVPEEPASPDALLDAAVSDAIGAGSYSFAGSVRLSVDGSSIETTLEGWVDGANRLLSVDLDGQQQTTRVIDGVATVVRGEESTQVSLSNVGEAPSLEILRQVEGLRLEGSDLIGRIDASALSGSGFDPSNDARIVIRLTDDGRLAGYDLSSADLTWSMTVDFSEFGATFSG